MADARAGRLALRRGYGGGDALAVCVAAFLLVMGGGARAQESGGADIAVSGQATRVTAQASDDVFVSGRTVRVDGTIADTVFAAGREVVVTADTDDDVGVAGRTVTVTGRTGGNLFAAGSELRLTGAIEGDAYLAATTLRTGPARISGDLNLMASQARIDGPVSSMLRAAGRNIVINSRIDGDAKVAAERLELGPNARIGGTLILRSNNKPVVSQGAVIVGGIRQTAADDDEERVSAGIAGSVILGTAGAWIIGALCFVAAPGAAVAAAAAVRDNPLRMLLIGLLVALLTLPVLMLLAFTIIGIPFALALGGLYLFAVLAAVPVAALGGAILLAQWRTQQIPPPRRVVLVMLLATSLALALLGVIPFAGSFLLAVVALLGMAILVQAAVVMLGRGGQPRREGGAGSGAGTGAGTLFGQRGA